MHKLETPLSNFRLNNSNRSNEGPYNITWYVLGTDDVVGEDARCFTYSELQQFQDYVVNLPVNFGGAKNYSICRDGETPKCRFATALIDTDWSFPTMVILRKVPQKSKAGTISSCMDIVLTDLNGDDNHSYYLEFNVVGEMQS